MPQEPPAMMTLIVREAGKPERAVQTSQSFVKLGRVEAMVHVHVTDPGAGKVLRGAIPRIHVLYEDAQVATDGPVLVLRGGEEVFQARFMVPGNAPGSFGTDGQLLVWSLAAEVAVSMCPNWVAEQVVEVSRGECYRRGSVGR